MTKHTIMPELPEVETVRRGLEQRLINRTLSHVHVLGTLRTKLNQQELEEFCHGRSIRAVRRRAKYLLVVFQEGDGLLLHLGMTGSMAVIPNPPGQQCLKHCQVYWELDGQQAWLFHDIRKFGILQICREDISTGCPRCLEGKLGPEPLGPDFTASHLFSRSRNHSTSVKEFIMDQRNVVGVGNIYASESLFRARINPRRQAGKVSLAAYQRLVPEVRELLQEAIDAGGTTISDFRNLEGTAGGFDSHLRIYGKADQPCPACGSPIRRCVLGGRSTFYCPHCQH